MLQRTQVLLDTQTKEELKEMAWRTNRSLSSLLRELLQGPLSERKSQRKKGGGVDFLRHLAKASLKGPGNGHYDQYAY